MVDPRLLEPYVHQATILLTTYRRNGTPVGTPVNIAVEDDHAYIRSYRESGKAKRLRKNPNVTIQPSSYTGKPKPGTMPLALKAQLLHGEEAMHASRLVRRKYRFLHGVVVPILHRLGRHRTVHYRLS